MDIHGEHLKANGADSRPDGESEGLFGNTIESLRSHMSFTLRPHLDEILGALSSLVRAEKVHLGLRLRPAGTAARRASVLFGVIVALGLFALVFTGCAVVAIILLTVPGEYQVPLLIGLGALFLAVVFGLGVFLVKAIRDVKNQLSNVAAQYKETR